MSNRRAVLAGSFVVSLAIISLFGLAAQPEIGPLEPPAGPVSDTSPSLVDLQNSLDELSANVDALLVSSGSCCPPPKYRYKLVDNVSAANGSTLVNESGVIHKIKYQVANSINVTLRDISGDILVFNGNYAPQWEELNLRFDQYLKVYSSGNTADLEILYARDSDY